MVRDRIAELCASQRNESTFGRSLLEDVHMAMSLNRKVNNVLEEAEHIRELIDLLVVNISAVRDLHNNVLSHTNPDISKELEGRTFIIGQTAKRVRDKLKEMAKDIPSGENLAPLETAREGPAHMRMKTLQYTTMQQMFSDIMLEYNELLLRYYEKRSSLLNQQRVLIRKPSTNNNSTDRYSEEDETEEKQSLFVDNESINNSILEDSHLAKQQLSEIQSRHEEVLKLEKSITEIRDIFLEMAYAIEKQGDQVNCVEYFAGKASANLDNVRSDLTKAQKRSRKYRKRKWKIVICFAVIFVILIIIAIYL